MRPARLVILTAPKPLPGVPPASAGWVKLSTTCITVTANHARHPVCHQSISVSRPSHPPSGHWVSVVAASYCSSKKKHLIQCACVDTLSMSSKIDEINKLFIIYSLHIDTIYGYMYKISSQLFIMSIIHNFEQNILHYMLMSPAFIRRNCNGRLIEGRCRHIVLQVL